MTLPFSSLRAFSPLFRAYVSDFDRLASYYTHDFHEADTLHNAARVAALQAGDRKTLTQVLRRQNTRWGADAEAHAAIDMLAEGDVVAVVTGQQLGLFGGPIYTLYKTLTAIQLARKLTAEGQRAVPVFWLHGEDHDFDEIASVTVLDGDDATTLRYDHPVPQQGNAGPVGRLLLTADITRVLDALEALLPVTLDRDTLMGVLRDAYAPGTALVDAFARFFCTLFPHTGLVFINPDDADLKKLLVPLFQHDVRASAVVAEKVALTSDALEADGFHAQVHVSPTNLFHVWQDGRLAIDAEGDGYRVRGTDKEYMQEELLAEIARRPERFSPNVMLRPLAQDTLLPTVAYVAGPGEIAYYAQFRPAYASAGVPMPVIYPRVSATLVTPRVQKLMARHALTLPDVDATPEQAFQRLAEARLSGEVTAAMGAFECALEHAVDEVKPVLTRLDVNLAKSAEATRARLHKEIKRLHTRVVRAEKRQQQDLQQAVARVQAHLFPRDKGQERVLSMCYMLAACGYNLPLDLLGALPLDTTRHHVVAL